MKTLSRLFIDIRRRIIKVAAAKAIGMVQEELWKVKVEGEKERECRIP